MGIPYAEVIGDPIAHSKSPIIHKFWLAKLGLDYDFHRARVSTGELAEFLEQRRLDRHWCGCNVTIPNKIAIAELLDELCGAALVVGAVNCVTRTGAEPPRLLGHNTDIAGFLEPLKPWLDRNFGFRQATVIGTGGAAAAISLALSKSGFLIESVGRDLKKAADFRRRVGLDGDPYFAAGIEILAEPSRRARLGSDDDDSLNIIVNATPLGMNGFPPLPVNLAGSLASLLVYDIVYDPLETQLLRDARALGLQTIDGLQMLVGQAAAAFEMFFMEKPPRQHDAELRELLIR
jgi:shikimate dehydrogenase